MDTNNVNNGVPENALSLYNQTDDALDDFPVLKAFQQYIDAEQAKARKRLLTMGIFFGAMTFVIIAIFVALLMRTTSQNQALNDRLLDLALRDRDSRGSSAVVVQPPQDNSGLMALNAKLDEMQKKFAESQKTSTQVIAPASPSREALEIERLKLMLATEKEKAAAEKEKRRQEELEAYRRRQYPELYQQPNRQRAEENIDAILDELSIDPSDDETDEEIEKRRPRVQRNKRIKAQRRKVEKLEDDDAVSYFDEAEDSGDEQETKDKSANKPEKAEKKYSIPVDIKGSSSNWDIPLE